MQALPRIILASESPRRKELMELLNLDYEVIPSEFDESQIQVDCPQDLVRSLAFHKAQDVAKKNTNALVIGADTVVVKDQHVLGKPKDEEDAVRMLTLLSNGVHQVMTGLSVLQGAEAYSDVVITDVLFRKLSPEEIRAYVATGEPMDKAGAYAIQGFGTVLIEGIRGCYFNVVGLPVSRLAGMLRYCGVPILGFYE